MDAESVEDEATRAEHLLGATSPDQKQDSDTSPDKKTTLQFFLRQDPHRQNAGDQPDAQHKMKSEEMQGAAPVSNGKVQFEEEDYNPFDDS